MTDTTTTDAEAADPTKPADAAAAGKTNAAAPAQAATTQPTDAPMETMMSDSTAPGVKALGGGGSDLQPAATQSPAPNPLLSGDVPAEQIPALPAAAKVPDSAAGSAPTVPLSEIDLMTQILGDAMSVGVTSLSLAATVPDASGGKPAYVSVILSYFGTPPAGTKIGSVDDLMTTLSTALKDEALLGETMAVESGYTCQVAITRG